MTRRLTEQTLKGASWLGGASLVRLGLGLVSVPILARLLTPHEYGVVAGATVVMGLTSMIYGLGLVPTLIQRKEVSPDHVATAFSTSLAMAVLAGTCMWFTAPFVADFMRIPELSDVVKILALLTPLGAFTMICEALLVRNMNQKEIAVAPLLSFVVSTFAVAVPLAYLGFGYWALVAMQTAETIMASLTLGIVSRRLLIPPGFSVQAFHELWPMGLGFSLTQPFVYLSTNAERFLIGRLIGAEALGLYTRASFLTTIAANLFGNIARTTLLPAMALVQDDNERLQNAILKTLSLTALTTLPISAFCIVFAREIIVFLLGAQWTSAAIPFALLAPMLYLRLGLRNCYALFQALGRPYLTMGTHGLHALLLVIGAGIAAPYGLAAVCVAALGVTSMIFALLLIVTSVRLGLSFTKLADVHLAPLAVAAAVTVLGMLLKVGGLSGSVLLLAGTLGAVALGLALLRLRPRLVMYPYGAEIIPLIWKSVPGIKETPRGSF